MDLGGEVRGELALSSQTEWLVIVLSGRRGKTEAGAWNVNAVKSAGRTTLYL